MKHYIVFYKGMYPEKGSRKSYQDESLYIYGDLPISTKTYPNKKTTQKQIEEQYALRWVHIINIVEVTKEQSDNYYK